MDPEYPDRFPINTNGIPPQVHANLRPGEASSDDQRLVKDFVYRDANGFISNRGYYHFSNYQYKRYPYIRDNGVGLLYDFRKYENDLYMAEAYIMLNQADKAKEILNDPNNPRIDSDRED